MATKKATSSTGKVGLLDMLEGIVDECKIPEARSYKPVPTGIDVLDWYNGRFFMVPDPQNQEGTIPELFTGMPISKLILKIGYTGSGKTTLGVQEGMEFVRPYDVGMVYHFDLENAWSLERTADICKMTVDEVKRKYKRFPPVTIDVIYAFLKKVINTKEELMKDPNSDVWVIDVHTGEKVPAPTVVIIDTVAALQTDQVMNENEEMGKLMFEQGHQAKMNNTLARRMAGMIGNPNITIIAINHITVAINEGGTPKAKRVQYLNQDEAVPGGTGFPQYADYYLKMVPCESLTNNIDEGFAIPGKMVRCTILKSRLSYDGRQFELVLSDDGFDNSWTNLQFLKKAKCLRGAGAHMFIENMSGVATQKFAQRNFKQLYENDTTFRTIVDDRLAYELEALVPRPGSMEEAILREEAKKLEVDPSVPLD